MENTITELYIQISNYIECMIDRSPTKDEILEVGKMAAVGYMVREKNPNATGYSVEVTKGLLTAHGVDLDNNKLKIGEQLYVPF